MSGNVYIDIDAMDHDWIGWAVGGGAIGRGHQSGRLVRGICVFYVFTFRSVFFFFFFFCFPAFWIAGADSLSFRGDTLTFLTALCRCSRFLGAFFWDFISVFFMHCDYLRFFLRDSWCWCGALRKRWEEEGGGRKGEVKVNLPFSFRSFF